MKRVPPALWVLLGCLVCQMGLGFSYIFTTFLRSITTDLGWSRATFGGYSGPLLFSMALSAPLVGGLTDRFGPRRVLGFAALLLAGTLVLFAGMQNVGHFYGTALVFGVALTGLGDIPVGSVASRWFQKGRGLALGVIYTGSNIGGAIVPVAATALKEQTSWRVALFALAAAALVFILPFAWLSVRMPRLGEIAAPESDSRTPADAPVQGIDLRAAMRTRTFWILAFALVTFYFYYLGVLFHLVAFLGDIGYSDPKAARNFGGAVFMGVFGKLGMGVLADRIPKKTTLLANFGLVTLSSFLLLQSGDRSFLLAFLVIYGFAVAAENVLLPLIVAEAFGVRHMAQIYGALMVTLLPGGFFGPVFAGYAFDTWGSYDRAFQTFAVLNVASLAALFFVKRHVAESRLG